MRADAQHQRIPDDAGAKTDAGMQLHHRRRKHHAGNLREHGLLVFAGERVVVDHAFRADGPPARVFKFDGVGADLLNLAQNELLAGQPYGNHQDHRGGADDHAQRGQRKAQLAGAKAVEGQLQNLAQHHGAAGAQQRLLKGAVAGVVGLIHKYSLQWSVNSSQFRSGKPQTVHCPLVTGKKQPRPEPGLP